MKSRTRHQAESGLEQDLQRRFERLCDLSVEQMEALDHENFDRLTRLLNEKDVLLKEIKHMHESEQAVDRLLRDVNRTAAKSPATPLQMLVRRFRAHEKYVARIVQQKLSLIGDRMKSVQSRRSAAEGYTTAAPKSSSINLAG